MFRSPPTFRTPLVLAATLLSALLYTGLAHAKPVSHTRTESNVDYSSAGVGGVSTSGAGTIEVTGVSGTVTAAYLYWHGIDAGVGSDGIYDNATVAIDGNSVTGVNIGDSSTNCWSGPGAGSSTAFRADVTSFVRADGSYEISGLSNGAGNSSNGASIVVIFDDGNSTNDRDLAFFEGNDSNDDDFPGEDTGWHGMLPAIAYDMGAVSAQVHAGDGQAFGDGALVFTTQNGQASFPDDATHYDGLSTPSEGGGRDPNVALWDIHDYDITPAFGGVAGAVALNIDGMDFASDCLSLVLLLLDLEPGTAPPPPGITLKPEIAVNPEGTEHAMEATVADDAGPIAGEEVTFDVISGPNAGDTAIGATDASGTATFNYSGDGGKGVDEIVATYFFDSEETDVASNTALKFWDADCNANSIADTCDLDCNGFDSMCSLVSGCGLSFDESQDGVPDECVDVIEVDLTPAESHLPLEGQAILTASVLLNAQPGSGIEVTFDVVSGPNAGETATVVTTQFGRALYTYSSDTEGIDEVVASVTNEDGTVSSPTVKVGWGAGRFQVSGWGESVQVYGSNFADALSLDTDADKVAIFAAQTDGVYILDVTKPFDIEVLGHYNPDTCDAGGIEVPLFADDAFLVEDEFEFVDPNCDGSDEECAVQAHVMHVAAADCGVHVVSLADLANPRLLATYGDGTLTAEAVDVYVGGEGSEGPCQPDSVAFSYVAGLDSFDVFDVSDAAHPMSCTSIPTTDAALGEGPIVSLDFFLELDDEVYPALIEGYTMNVAVGTGDGARVINVDDPNEPIVEQSYLTPTAAPFSPYRITQHIRVSDDGEAGFLSSWAAGFQVVTEEPDDSLSLYAHEPTSSAFYGSDECWAFEERMICAAEGQIGLTRLFEDEVGFDRLDESEADGQQSIPVGPPGAFAWDTEVDQCLAYVTYGVFEGLCDGGSTPEASCTASSQCNGGVCVFPGGLDVIPLDGCGFDVLQEEPSADSDGDGVADASDNCSAVANAGQQDADLDGYGNVCDADLNNDGAVGILDFQMLVSQIGQSGTSGDLNADGSVGVQDLGLLQGQIGAAPGPSGLACAGTVPCP